MRLPSWRNAGPIGRCAVAIVLLGPGAARAGQPAAVSPAATEALALCDAADRVPAVERSVVLARGLDRAAEAVKTDPEDPRAHFAVFCNLGKRLRMERSGSALFAALRELQRARREIDIALALAPDYSSALAAKGKMLIELPRLLGGDAREGERLLRCAMAIAPDDQMIRGLLADVSAAVGQPDEAVAHAAIDDASVSSRALRSQQARGVE